MSQMSALIVDDQPNNILVLKQLLMVEGIDVVEMRGASNIEQLNQELNKIKQVDIIFLDLEMPKLNGYQVLDAIKQHPDLQKVKTVAYSVHLQEIDSAISAGFDAFLGKPLNAEAFPEQLERIMRGELVRHIP